MSPVPFFDANASYTFADYFKFNAEPEDILANFGYSYEVSELQLPKSNREFDRLPALKQRLVESLPYISLASEMARREFLIAPLLMDLIYYTKSKVRVSYSLRISEQLKGELDYYIRSRDRLFVVEAKNADLLRGFTQLAVELIAVDRGKLTDSNSIYGAVTSGNIWQFGLLDRDRNCIFQDLNLYRVPADLQDVFAITVGILTGDPVSRS